jgi:uncharacterized protein (DUF2237 family)
MSQIPEEYIIPYLLRTCERACVCSARWLDLVERRKCPPKVALWNLP